MDNYEKVKKVGQGAFGSVYLCRRLSDRSLVIVKQVPLDGLSVSERQEALKEVQVFKMLTHPNIIAFYENFIEENALCIAMEYASGGTLASFLGQKKDNPCTEEEVLWYFAQIVLSVHHLHVKQILHRDLKPQNILLNRDKTIIKLSDFGISKVLTRSRAHSVIGSPYYISPEVYQREAYEKKSDIWALGCILFELISLQKAFDAETLPALCRKVINGEADILPDRTSAALRRLVGDCLAMDPNKRPSAAEIMTYPIMIRPILQLMTDIGKLSYERPLRQPSGVLAMQKLRTGSNKSIRRQIERGGTIDLSMRSRIKHRVFYWGKDVADPVSLPLISPTMQVKQVGVGSAHKAVLGIDGQIHLWEESICAETNEPYHELKTVKMNSPVLFSAVAVGDKYMACMSAEGVLMTFGSGISGCLGHGTTVDIAQPKIIEPLVSHSVIKVSCGARHMAALTDQNKLFTWGRGDNGRLGLGTTEPHSTPQLVPLPVDVKKIHHLECSLDATAIVASNGDIYCCGGNANNKLGLSESRANPVKSIPLLSPSVLFPQIDLSSAYTFSLGPTHTMLIGPDKRIYMLGSNKFGQLGPPPIQNKTDQQYSLTEMEIPSGNVPSKVLAGDTYSLAVSEDQLVWCWGRNKSSSSSGSSHQDAKLISMSPIFSVKDIVSVACSDGITLVATRGREKPM